MATAVKNLAELLASLTGRSGNAAVTKNRKVSPRLAASMPASPFHSVLASQPQSSGVIHNKIAHAKTKVTAEETTAVQKDLPLSPQTMVPVSAPTEQPVSSAASLQVHPVAQAQTAGEEQVVTPVTVKPLPFNVLAGIKPAETSASGIVPAQNKKPGETAVQTLTTGEGTANEVMPQQVADQAEVTVTGESIEPRNVNVLQAAVKLALVQEATPVASAASAAKTFAQQASPQTSASAPVNTGAVLDQQSVATATATPAAVNPVPRIPRASVVADAAPQIPTETISVQVSSGQVLAAASQSAMGAAGAILESVAPISAPVLSSVPSPLRADIPGQIAQAVVSSLDSGLGQQVVIQLNPPELGRVRLTLETRDDQIQGVLRVDDPNTLAQIRQETPALLHRLNQSGLDVRQIDIIPTHQNLASQQYQQNADGGARGQQQQLPWRDPWQDSRESEVPETVYAGAEPDLDLYAGAGSVNAWA